MADKKPLETKTALQAYERRGFAMDGALKNASQIKERPPAPAPMRPTAAMQVVETKTEVPEKK